MATLDEVYTELKSTHKDVVELLQWKAAMDERCEAHRQQTDELRGVIFDNPGLKSRVERLWNCKKDAKTSREVWRNFFLWILRALIVAVIIGFAGWLISMLKFS